MNWVKIILLVALTIVPSIGSAKGVTGADWAKLSKDFKLGIIVGWVYAGEKAIKKIQYDHLVLQGAFDFTLKKRVPPMNLDGIPYDLPKNTWDAEMRKALNMALIHKLWTDVKESSRPGEHFFMCHSLEKFQKQEGIGFVGVSMGQIMEMTNQVYSDPRVKNWEISEIMPMVRGRLIDAWTLSDLDEVIVFRMRQKSLHDKAENVTGPQLKEIFTELDTLKKPKVLDFE